MIDKENLTNDFDDDKNDSTLVYGVYTPFEKNTKEVNSETLEKKKEAAKYVTSFVPPQFAKLFYFHVYCLSPIEVDALKYIFKTNEKIKKIRYIKEKAQGIDEFINVNLSIIHNELNDVSDDMLSFIYNIVKLTCEDQEVCSPSSCSPQSVDEQQLKDSILSIVTSILEEHKEHTRKAYVIIFEEILNGADFNFLFILHETLKKKVL